MSYIVYVRIKGTDKGAHQYVIIGGVRIGEIWRQQVNQRTSRAGNLMKWRWFALSYHKADQAGTLRRLSFEGFGTKDKAVDALENAFLAVGIKSA
jgi:hypothetical protein